MERPRWSGLYFMIRRAAYSLLATVVFSTLGVFLIILSVHGPKPYAYLGLAMLLPSLALLRIGAPIAIPKLATTPESGLLIFSLCQYAYYYFLISVLASLASTFRRKKACGFVGVSVKTCGARQIITLLLVFAATAAWRPLSSRPYISRSQAAS